MQLAVYNELQSQTITTQPLYSKISMGSRQNSCLLLVTNSSPLLYQLNISNKKTNKSCIPLELIFDPAPSVTAKHQHEQKHAGRNEQLRAKEENMANPHVRSSSGSRQNSGSRQISAPQG